MKVFCFVAVLLLTPLTLFADDDPKEPAKRDSISHVPGSGFTIAKGSSGTANFRLYATVRYLNETGLDDRYTDSFGTEKPVTTLHDFQVNKTVFYFFGWLLDPKLRYLTYAWTTNSSQGLGAQVVLAGNITYRFSPRATLGFGITGLPCTRSTASTWPSWLGVDNRVIADEFFRGSYTTGIWLNGKLTNEFGYDVMLGNNLSQLGIDAGQLDHQIDTFSGMLYWMPTTGEYGKGYGDFEHHEQAATRIGVHYTQSNEDRQSQPSTEAPDNSQIRLSDGNVIFTPGLFGPGIAVEKVAYHMAAVNAGVKWRGCALEGEYYLRRIDNLRGAGLAALPFGHLTDHGVTWNVSAMAVPRTLEIYARGSAIMGEHGDPWDVRGGASWYPWKNQTVRWHNEIMYLKDCPVGALSLPYSVGGNGMVFNSNFEINF